MAIGLAMVDSQVRTFAEFSSGTRRRKTAPLSDKRVHHVRDVTFREELHEARTGSGPAVIATLRNTSIGYHRANGDTNIARATRRANRRPHELTEAVTSGNPTTQ
jgi:hypothetical protein